MRWIVLLMALVACSPTEPVAAVTDTTIVLRDAQIYRVTALGVTDRIDVELVGPGGNNNTFMRGSSGAWVKFCNVPFVKGDSLFASRGAALAPTADSWLIPAASYVAIRPFGFGTATAGTNFGEGGQVMYDVRLKPFVCAQQSGLRGNDAKAGSGWRGFGAGGDAVLPAQDGYVAIRLYRRD